MALAAVLCCFFSFALLCAAQVNNNVNVNVNRRDRSRNVEIESEKHYLDSGHCKAICLDNYLSVLENKNESVSAVNLMDSCRNNHHFADCNACLRGCEMDNSGLPLDCPIHCSNNSVCIRSCILVHDLYYFHAGKCPSAQSVVCNVSSDNFEECQNDGDCREIGAKCCASNCGRQVCSRALPVRPPKATITTSEFQENPATQDLINVEWKAESSRDRDREMPLVFVLQMRQQYSNDDVDRQWRTIVEDTKTGAQIENIPLCQKYQYRVAAVSPASRGLFSTPTAFLGSDNDAKAPSKPLNAEVIKMVLRDGKVDLDLRWNPPAKSDLPIVGYEVSWVKRIPVPESNEPTYGSVQTQRMLKPTDLSCTISDLEKDAEFKITVTANSRCVRSILQGEPTVVVHRTAVTSSTQSENESKRDDSSGCAPVAEQSQANFNVLYNNGLQATISWSAPQVSIPISSYRVEWRVVSCVNDPFQLMNPRNIARNQTVTKNTYVTISQLEFTCEYEFLVRTFAIDNSCYLLVRKQLHTPSCTEVQLAPRQTSPICAPTGILPLPAPEKVSVRLRPQQDRFEAFVSWSPPAVRIPAPKYRVLFGKSIFSSPNLIDKLRFRKDRFIMSPPNLPPIFDHAIDRNRAMTKVVTNRSMILLDLEPNAVYVVHIQTLTEDNYSRATRVYFATLANDEQRRPRPASNSTRTSVVKNKATCTCWPSWVPLISLCTLFFTIKVR